MANEAPRPDAAAEHEKRRVQYAAEAARHEDRSRRLSAVSIVTFLCAGIAIATAFGERSTAWFAGGGALAVAFVAVFVANVRTTNARDRAQTRADLHAQHLRRIAIDLHGMTTGGDLLPADHPYASDLDLTGAESLFSRLAVARTRRGEHTLARWLGAPAARATIAERQAAVAELAGVFDLREALEAAGLDTGAAILDDRPFLDFVRRPAVLYGKTTIVVGLALLPVVTMTLFGLSGSVIPSWSWVPLLVVQMIIATRLEPAVRERHTLLVSRARYVEAFRALLTVAESAKVEAPRLVALQRQLAASGALPSRELFWLETWAGLFELRSQGPPHLFANLFLLWDANVLARLEAWCARAGSRCEGWFEALGELEALSSLATLLAQDPAARIPEIGDDATFHAEGLVHPLLPVGKRVANDLELEGKGTALLITGSNMAGKSTLLRAVGASVALALAGGPVCARSVRVPIVRLRASMRIADSLQHGASYFQAELARLRQVVERAEDEPPIFFLLDELLRGTNARARHKGGRAVVLHLLARGATGLVATHDIALHELEAELSGRVKNVHFTDVFEDGEMKFDYRLRPGVVRTSNALRLLSMAGIDVEVDTKLDDGDLAPPPSPRAAG